MKLVLQTRVKFRELTAEDDKEYDYYYKYVELEIDTFRWNKNHEFEYSVKNSAIWSKLEDNEEIVGLGL